jgi:hypothetical protein
MLAGFFDQIKQINTIVSSSTILSPERALSKPHPLELILDFQSVTMAPKKAKKTADSINSRLALVMKSGKGTKVHCVKEGTIVAEVSVQSLWATSRLSNPSALARPSLLSLPATLLHYAKASLNTTRCCQRPMFTISLETM